MTVVPAVKSSAAEIVELCTGDRMTQEEFHRAYEQTPDDFKAELVGGTVYVASPLKLRHGTDHVLLTTLFGIYTARTPGVEAADNATVLLGAEGEPQPDLFLRITPQSGGQSRTSADGYVVGAPELVAEIALSSRSIDLHAKREDYQRYGVQEYLVLVIADQRLRWFDLRENREREADEAGIMRLRLFPGFWLHAQAIAANDYVRAMSVLEEGLRSPEHAAFVERLREARG